jgi:hypothetical protein
MKVQRQEKQTSMLQKQQSAFHEHAAPLTPLPYVSMLELTV